MMVKLGKGADERGFAVRSPRPREVPSCRGQQPWCFREDRREEEEEGGAGMLEHRPPSPTPQPYTAPAKALGGHGGCRTPGGGWGASPTTSTLQTPPLPHGIGDSWGSRAALPRDVSIRAHAAPVNIRTASFLYKAALTPGAARLNEEGDPPETCCRRAAKMCPALPPPQGPCRIRAHG